MLLRAVLVRLTWLLALPAALVSPPEAQACTAFLLEQDGEVVVGKSYDWDQDAALVLHNQAGVAKSALPFFPGSKPHRWVSRHASLTFNQYGREFPVSGMNTAGLVVETLWLSSARLEEPDERPALNELQWVQWALDSFASVEELLAAYPGVRVERIHGQVHYLVCDREARCAACEPVGGRFGCQAGEALLARVLTNDTYGASRAFLQAHRGFGGERPIPRGNGSLERFARTAAAVALPPLPRVPAEARAFALLDGVSLGDYSKWNLVYLPRAGRVLWRTSARRAIRQVDLARFEPGCDKPVQMLDIQAAVEGDAAGRFAPYTDQANLKLLGTTLRDLPLPPGTATLMTAFAGRLACAPQDGPPAMGP